MDPISLTLIAVSAGLSVFSGIKQNQAAKEQGQQAVQEKAEANTLARYKNELAEVEKKTAIEIETARLRELARQRQKRYVQLELVGVSLLAFMAVLILIRNIRER
ncbi:hypothetical protein BWI97_14285 [Siphonobacter sp. BAB-5405]|uniref:hypothetical protein n=1 Tax=Siphonobacter sp. BAB-5405 TaxID=1864825 RepID=UPI000C80D329|nr:hypothetical protein [Siphonobacter sp. BAB-5405]PMD95520.1 hypothetical protein BWI97_14285 [Siphonobacter sp. BAB-5405]